MAVQEERRPALGSHRVVAELPGSRGWWICQGRANGTQPMRAGLARTASSPTFGTAIGRSGGTAGAWSIARRSVRGQGGPGGGQAAAGGEGARRTGTSGNKKAVNQAAAGKSHASEPVVEEMEEIAIEETVGIDKLMAEATQLLKSLRMKKLKAARLSKIGECQSWGLLDGGATHALRQARKGETGDDRMVELADGREVVMQTTEDHTLICKEATQVIVPLGALYLLGYKIRWEEGICCIEHASRGPLPVRMRQFCPEVPTEVALRLVAELEEFNIGTAPEGGYSGDQEHEEAGHQRRPQEGPVRQGCSCMEERRDGEGEGGV